MLTPWKKSYGQPGQHIKKQRYYFANKGLSSQSYGFSSSHVWMSKLDHKESWAPKLWCFWTVMLEETLESPLDCKEIQPVHSEGDQPWDFFGGNDAKAETLILWPPDVKNWLIGKDPDAGKDWRWEEKGMTLDEMVGWTWNWVSSRSWWWTGRPGMLQSMGLQRVGYDWGTELNWIIHCMYFVYPLMCWWTHGLPIPFGYCVSKYLFESLLSHLWRIYPEVEFLTHRIILF